MIFTNSNMLERLSEMECNKFNVNDFSTTESQLTTKTTEKRPSYDCKLTYQSARNLIFWSESDAEIVSPTKIDPENKRFRESSTKM